MRFLFFFLFIPFFQFAFTGGPTDSIKVVEQKVEKLEWLSIEEVLVRQSEEPRYWLIDVYTDWCGWCKRMDALTFTDSLVVKELKENFYVVKFDAESERDIVIGERTYKFVPQGRRGYHELAAEMMNGKMSYPTIVYFDNEGRRIQPVPGYQTPEQILPILRYLGSGAYKTVPWDQYMESYESPYQETAE